MTDAASRLEEIRDRWHEGIDPWASPEQAAADIEWLLARVARYEEIAGRVTDEMAALPYRCTDGDLDDAVPLNMPEARANMRRLAIVLADLCNLRAASRAGEDDRG